MDIEESDQNWLEDVGLHHHLGPCHWFCVSNNCWAFYLPHSIPIQGALVSQLSRCPTSICLGRGRWGQTIHCLTTAATPARRCSRVSGEVTQHPPFTNVSCRIICLGSCTWGTNNLDRIQPPSLTEEIAKSKRLSSHTGMTISPISTGQYDSYHENMLTIQLEWLLQRIT